MIRKISFLTFLLFILIFSAGAIQASDVNVTDVSLDSSGDIDFQIEDAVQLDDIADESLAVSDDEPLGDDSKNQTQLTSPTSAMYYSGNYQVTLMDSNATVPLEGKSIDLTINNVKYSAKTNANGIASINLKLNPGSYLATASFAGDDTYGPSNVSGSLNILTTIKAADISKYYKGSKSYQATFLDSQGNALKNKKVTISVNGKKYTKTTNANGVASVPINLKPGNYKVTATNPSTGYQLTTNFKILSTVTASNLKKVKGDSKKFVAKFYKSNGKALAKQKVKVKIKGKTYKYKTNSKGQVSLSFNNFKKGTYKVICYNKDGLSKSSTVQIFNKASTKISMGVYTFLEDETKEIKIRFSTALDDNSKAGKKISIYVDGETYYRTTDSNGEISLRLSSLDYADLFEVECYYNGNKFFSPSYTTGYVTVLDSSDTDLEVVTESLSFGSFAGTPLQVALTAGDGIPLVKRTVCFTVNGKDYNAVTDYWGIASFPVKLDVGTYTVNFKSFEDSRVKASSGSCNITVFKRTATKLSFEFGSTIKDSAYTLKVRLTDSNGNPVKYQDVELTFNGETQTETTNSKGYATFYASISLGKYKVSAKFKGSNQYTSSSASKTVKVTLSKYKNGINEKKASASSQYLKGSKNAPTNNAKIKKLVKSLTKGLKTPVDKARALFRYVRDNIEYDYYYGAKKGAIGTLNSKKANCVDQSNLLVSMFRTAGLKTRYVQGVCTYSDGTFYHYWTQVLLDNTWVCADPVGRGNELGQINDWNTKTFKFVGKYLTT